MGRITMLNVLLAFFAAPFLALLITAPLFAAYAGEISAWGLYFGFGLFFAYSSTVLVGIPLYVITTRVLGVLKAWHCAAGGLLSAVPFCLNELDAGGTQAVPSHLAATTSFSLLTGLIAGAAFWKVREVLKNEDIKRSRLKDAA